MAPRRVFTPWEPHVSSARSREAVRHPGDCYLRISSVILSPALSGMRIWLALPFISTLIDSVVDLPGSRACDVKTRFPSASPVSFPSNQTLAPAGTTKITLAGAGPVTVAGGNRAGADGAGAA